MRLGNIAKMVGFAVMTAGFATTAFAQSSPYIYHEEDPAPNVGNISLFQHFAVDFTANSANSAYNMPTFPNPKATSLIVRYFPYSIVAAVSPGGCYEITSSGASGSDPLLSVQNNAGTWKALSDDNGGNLQITARVYVKPSARYEFRISEYASGNSNNQIQVYVKKLNLSAYSGSGTPPSSSCYIQGVPYWQSDLLSGNPVEAH
jgi:hypothetical protein